MQRTDSFASLFQQLNRPITRGRLLTASAGVAGGALLAGAGIPTAFAVSNDNTSGDTAAQIFTAAMIAEDVASTFYYNGLVGKVIQDKSLAGPGGSATKVDKNAHLGDAGNVAYLRAALYEEISHANLFRSLLGSPSYTSDPNQTIFFTTGTFDTIGPFLQTLEALENAFIGAYMAAIGEFAAMAADAKAGVTSQTNPTGGTFTSTQLEYFAKVAGAIMGIECEHRVLGRDIGGMVPADNLTYEQTDGINTVFNGSSSAVTALTPFLTGASGTTGYSLGTALKGAPSVWIQLPNGGGPLPSSSVKI